jgi:hypothetical protein|tara:strand:- start:198 stop:419 length:222 start_codon:yes stop_codon:yes gene_type:complete
MAFAVITLIYLQGSSSFFQRHRLQKRFWEKEMKDKFFKDNEALVKALTGKTLKEIKKELEVPVKEHDRNKRQD